MASLKEVKNRINSVQSTRKITSAMKLVASSKLHKAQASIESMLPYERQLNRMMSRFVSEMQGEVSSFFVEQRKVNKAVVIPISSNSFGTKTSPTISISITIPIRQIRRRYAPFSRIKTRINSSTSVQSRRSTRRPNLSANITARTSCK